MNTAPFTMAGGMLFKCPVCGMRAETKQEGLILWNLNCFRCGSYQINDTGIVALRQANLTEKQMANMSGYVRENSGLLITEQELEFLLNLRTPLLSEKASKLLRWIAKQNPKPGQEIAPIDFKMIGTFVFRFLKTPQDLIPEDGGTMEARKLLSILSAAWAIDVDELRYLLVDYLSMTLHFVNIWSRGSGNQIERGLKITPAGWRSIEEQPTGSSHVGFVAMWFSEEMREVWEAGFYPAIYAAGYTPIRIDKKEHNNKIDDEIIASIRAARFLVADFTGQRGGVYYEAGFALGLSKPVIWTVREDELKNVHFDTRQFNHIAWSPDKLPEFQAALKSRIEATLGHGPIRP
jgi:hypothetical protein